MKRSPFVYLLPVLGVFVLLGAVLYFIHPMAPLFLVASLLIQAPLVWVLSRASLGSSYRERAAARRQQYEKDGNAEAWVAGEEKEAASIGYKYWSKAGKSMCELNRADGLVHLGRKGDAGQALAQVAPQKLAAQDRVRYEELSQKLEQME